MSDLMSSHELARRLLALPDGDVWVEDEPGVTAYECAGAYTTREGSVIIMHGGLYLENFTADDDDG